MQTHYVFIRFIVKSLLRRINRRRNETQTFPLQKYSYPLKAFHVLCYNHKLKRILLGFYAVDKHKRMHVCIFCPTPSQYFWCNYIFPTLRMNMLNIKPFHFCKLAPRASLKIPFKIMPQIKVWTKPIPCVSICMYSMIM